MHDVSDEFTRIGAIRARFERVSARASEAQAGVVLGIGDDAAVLRATSSPQAVSVDASIEGVHFERWYASLEDIGWRAVMAALSDLAAMGAAPRAVLLSWVLPEELTDGELMRLVDGVADAVEHVGAVVVGGNLSGGPALGLHTTVIGKLAGGGMLRRDGAQVGDAIYVTGVLGASALGLRLLQGALHGPTEDQPTEDQPTEDQPTHPRQRFINAWCRPRAHIEEGVSLVGVATACVDVSDGFLQDLGHLCEASGVGAAITYDALPTQDGFAPLVDAMNFNAEALVLAGGEAYGLVYTVPADCAALSLPGVCVGTVTSSTGVTVTRSTGELVEVSSVVGFAHFGR